jgi:hypothetical protein
MAIRRALRTFDDLAQFLEEAEATLLLGGCYLPPGSVDGELAREFRLDLEVPLLGRVGPVRAQVVQKTTDGGYGLRLPEVEAEVRPIVMRVRAVMAQVQALLVEGGAVVPAADVASLRSRLVALEAQVAAGPPAPGAVPTRPVGRGFPLPDLTGLAPMAEGSLGGRGLRDAMVAWASTRPTGLLTLRLADGRERHGFWSKGGPVGWRTEPLQEDEALGVLLFRAGQITEAQLQESLEIMKRDGTRQGEALIEMGVLSFAQLVMVLGKQVEYIVQQVLKETEGSWTFHELPRHAEKFLATPLKVPALVLRALVTTANQMNMEEVANSLQTDMDRYLYLSEVGEHLLSDLRLDAVEKKFIEVIRSNSWRLREVFAISPLTRSKTAAFLWALNDLGFLVYEDKEGTARYMGRIAHRVMRKKAQLQKASHFDVLELHWVCLPQEIETSYARLNEEFTGDKYTDLPPELAKELAPILEGLRASHSVLKDDRQRRAYREEVIEKFMILQSAELLAKKGEMAIMRHDRREASGCFAKALELDPTNSSFRTGLKRAMTVG